MNIRTLIYVLAIAVAIIAVAVFDVFEIFVRNPPLNSAISAHGNTDWHIDTAEEFLFGTDMAGNTTAANHAPSSWTKTHIHDGLTNTNHFYYDNDLVTPGDDDDTTSGIDRNMLFFYAGHGLPMRWDTLGNSALPANLNLGDGPDGLLRYYWQCSCEVFAHGPRNCPSSTLVYACPEDFDGSSDSNAMRNVYERWGPVLGDDLRMACGVSTDAWCHQSNVNRIWDNYNNNGLDVADSFIEGLSTSTSAVPLCITTGGFFATGTPLFDQTFTNQRHDGGAFLHIQYLSDFASNAPPLMIKEPPELLPVFELIPRPLPDPWLKIKLIEKDGLLVSKETLAERGPMMRVNPLSGAMYVRGERKLDVKAHDRGEQDYIKLAIDHVNQQGWFEKTSAQPQGMKFIIDSMPREGKSSEANRVQKNVTVKFRRLLDIEGRKVPVFGAGSVISIQMNNDGSLLNAHKVWREIKAVKKQEKVKPYKVAEEQALKKLGDVKGYVLADWTWAYKERAGNVEQNELRMIYRFDFRPVAPEQVLKYPPQMIEVEGFVD